MTDAIVDPENKPVALFFHAKVIADAGEYENECIITVTMTEDGKLVQYQYNFIDSYTMYQWLQRVQTFSLDIWEKKWVFVGLGLGRHVHGET